MGTSALQLCLIFSNLHLLETIYNTNTTKIQIEFKPKLSLGILISLSVLRFLLFTRENDAIKIWMFIRHYIFHLWYEEGFVLHIFANQIFISTITYVPDVEYKALQIHWCEYNSLLQQIVAILNEIIVNMLNMWRMFHTGKMKDTWKMSKSYLECKHKLLQWIFMAYGSSTSKRKKWIRRTGIDDSDKLLLQSKYLL